MNNSSNGSFFKLLFLLTGLILLPVACNEVSSSTQPEPKLLDFNQFEVYGEVHNQFLTNVKENFIADNEITEMENALNYLNDFQQNYLFEADLKGLDKHRLSEALNNSKELSVHEKAYEKMFIRSKSDSEFNEEPSLYDLLTIAKEQGVVDTFEYTSLTQLSDKVKGSYEGSVSGAELKSFVVSLKEEWEEQEYTTESENGILMAYALSISLASIEWWEENTDAGLTETTSGKVMALPAWAAMDIGGAIVSGAIAVSGQAILADDISWDVVGYAALGGAVATSTGAAGKVAKWLGLM